jgi:predicted nucleic acid-binding protein
VVNASPLIVLAKAGLARVLDELAPDWCVPEAVVRDVLQAGPGDAGRELAERLPEHRRCRVAIPEIIASWDLDPGESEVLAWALAHRGHEAVVDDKAARTCARHLGIPCCGTVGVLVRAKRRGVLPAVRPALAAVRAAGLYLAADLETRALQLCQEV